MTNDDMAQVLGEIADLLEIDGADHFRVLAYRRGAEVVADQSRELGALAHEGGVKALSALPSIGKHLAEKLLELAETGRLEYHEELKSRFPEGLLELLRIPGLGPKKVALFYHELGIGSVEELAQALAEQRLRGLPGMGAKSEEKLAHALETYRESSQRVRLGEILPLAESLVDWLRGREGVLRADYAGSCRRGRETIGELDLLAAAEDPAALCAAFAGSGLLAEVLLAGDTKVSGLLPLGRQVDLRVVPPESYGAALQYFTGSAAHNVALRARAQKQGLTINEYGVFRVVNGEAGERVAGETEESVYAAVGLPCMPPELREDRGELAAAEAGTLPKLIEAGDIRGDLHCHTTASDGRHSLAEMVEAAEGRGYEYLGITEHSGSLYVAHGLDAERLRAHREAVDLLNAELASQGRSLRVLLGTEADLMTDGAVDIAQDCYQLLDYVIGSVHQGFTADADRMTARVLAALATGRMDIFGHPTGRMLLEREPYGLHLEEVLAAAVEHRVALEINASPWRLDLDDVHARLAQEQGAMLAINTDAHATTGLGDMRYGLLTARRGWIEAPTVINTWPLGKLQQWLKSRRK